MNETLKSLLLTYTKETHKTLSNKILDLSKETIKSCLIDLLTIYINDKNSSTLREYLTVTIAGYTHNSNKIGYNGYKLNVPNIPLNCEAKPKNICTQDFIDFENGARQSKPNKLNGGGNFTDYTWARFEKDKRSNLNMLISGFIDGKIVFILEFPFNSSNFISKIHNQLEKKFPNGDVEGYYLRSASFSFKDYKNDNYSVIYISKNIIEYERFLDKELFAVLKVNLEQ